MSDAIERLAIQYGLFLCVECGKCVAVCPMGEVFDDFSYEVSPRGVIERVLLRFETAEEGGLAEPVLSKILTTSRLWFCLTCDLCTDLCPAGVRFRDFVEAARRVAMDSGVTEHGLFCRRCGAYLWPRHTVEYLKQTLGDAADGLLTLCPTCRRYDFGQRVKALAPGSRRLCARGAEESTST